jgi:hypothetical protein
MRVILNGGSVRVVDRGLDGFEAPMLNGIELRAVLAGRDVAFPAVGGQNTWSTEITRTHASQRGISI